MAEFNPEQGVGRILSGQQYEPRYNINLPFTQQDLSYTGDVTKVTGQEGTPGLDQTPKDANDATDRLYNLTAIVNSLLGLYYTWFSYADLPPLPDVLTGITVTNNTASGNGSSSHPAIQSGATFTGGGTVSLSPHATAQASASTLPDILPVITQVWRGGVPAQNFAFYVSSTATLEQILSRATQYMVTVGTFTETTVTISQATPGVVTWTAHGLNNGQTVLLYTSGALPTPLLTTQVYYVVNKSTNTFELTLTSGGSPINTTTAGSGTQKAVAAVQQLPVFKTGFYTILVMGQQASVAASADTTAQVNSSFDGSSRGAAFNFGSGFSKSFGVTVKSVRIGPVINGAITITGSAGTASISASVEASTPAIVLNSGTLVTAITNAPSATTATVTGAVSPGTLSATTPSDIPRTGYYIVQINANVDQYGLQFMHVQVVNFGVFA